MADKELEVKMGFDDDYTDKVEDASKTTDNKL